MVAEVGRDACGEDRQVDPAAAADRGGGMDRNDRGDGRDDARAAPEREEQTEVPDQPEGRFPAPRKQ